MRKTLTRSNKLAYHGDEVVAGFVWQEAQKWNAELISVCRLVRVPEEGYVEVEVLGGIVHENCDGGSEVSSVGVL